MTDDVLQKASMKLWMALEDMPLPRREAFSTLPQYKSVAC